MSGYIAPALVENENDLIEYYVDGSDPVDPNAPKGYSERFIHGEIFKRFPEINSVVHSHAESVLPYAVGTDPAPMLPMYHMAGFLGTRVKVWDIMSAYPEHAVQNMLVNNAHVGSSLANMFSSSPDGPLEETVVLMQRHGYATHGVDIETAVDRAIYTLVNAGIQTQATLLQSATGGANATALSPQQAKDCRAMNEGTQDKAWRLWVRETQANSLYRNSMNFP